MNHRQVALGLRAADISLAYVLLRIVVGINYFNHGFTRMGNIPGFMDAMVGAMAGSWMPEPLVRFTAFFRLSGGADFRPVFDFGSVYAALAGGAIWADGNFDVRRHHCAELG